MININELIQELSKSMKLELYAKSYGIVIEEIDIEARCQISKRLLK